MESLGRDEGAPRRRREAEMGTFARSNGRPMAVAAWRPEIFVIAGRPIAVSALVGVG
jgi:hypothetical protein